MAERGRPYDAGKPDIVWAVFLHGVQFFSAAMLLLAGSKLAIRL